MEYDVLMGYYLNRHVDVTMAKKKGRRKEEEEDCLFSIILEENKVKVKTTKEDSDILTLFF